jgi:Pyruvate/2-oxoacid:ferredoxin oxidoreductase delta subunit
MKKTRVVKAKAPGSAIEKWFARKFTVTAENYDSRSKIFRKIMAGSMKATGNPVYGGLVTKLNQGKVIESVSVPLNVSLSEHTKQVALPADLLKKAVREATYRAGMHSCICRESIGGCKNYPDAPSCIFIGEGARQLVSNGLANELTGHEACARIDLAAKMGLLGHAYFIEAEQYFWGVPNENLDKFLEICFCCTCCCLNVANLKYASHAQKKTNVSLGWTIVVDDNCTLCHTCVEICPIGAISEVSCKMTVSDVCYGCSNCVPRCPQSARKLVHTGPPISDLKDAFHQVNLKL